MLLLCLAFVVLAVLASTALERVDFEDFKQDAATSGELIAYRFAAHHVNDWQSLLTDYTTEFNHRIGLSLIHI